MPEREPEKEHSWVTQMQPGPLQGHALFLPREGWGAGTRAIRHPNTERDEWTGCLSVHCSGRSPNPQVPVTSSTPQPPCGRGRRRSLGSETPLGAWDGQDTRCLILFPDKVIFVELGLPAKEEIRSGCLSLPDGCGMRTAGLGQQGSPESRQRCGPGQRESPENQETQSEGIACP